LTPNAQKVNLTNLIKSLFRISKIKTSDNCGFIDTARMNGIAAIENLPSTYLIQAIPINPKARICKEPLSNEKITGSVRKKYIEVDKNTIRADCLEKTCLKIQTQLIAAKHRKKIKPYFCPKGDRMKRKKFPSGGVWLGLLVIRYGFARWT
jgi:hypothetical protein